MSCEGGWVGSPGWAEKEAPAIAREDRSERRASRLEPGKPEASRASRRKGPPSW